MPSPQKKHTKKKDLSYRPGQPLYGEKKKKSPRKRGALLAIRARLTGKTSVLVNTEILPQALSSAQQEKLMEDYVQRLSEIKSFRPAANIIYKTPPASPTKKLFRSPKEVVTPNGTKLKKTTVYRPYFYFFTDDKDAIPVDDQVIHQKVTNAAYFNSPTYRQIKAFTQNIKTQSVLITPQLLKKSEKEYADNHYQRVTDQNSQMAKDGKSNHASATANAIEAGFYLQNIPWEWLHLVAYMILASLSQHEGNLVGGTSHANTGMMFAEGEIEFLSKHYPDGFNLKVSANMVENTQHASSIHFDIITKNLTLPFIFNAQDPNKPHIDYQEYIHNMVTLLVESVKALHNQNPVVSQAPIPQNKIPLPFFQRKLADTQQVALIQQALNLKV